MDDENQLVLVFIHLGTHACPWLKKNILRTRALFPSHTVLLASDNDALIAQFARLNVDTFRYRGGIQDIELETNTDWDLSFRSKFWLQTTRRFIVLAAVQESLQRPVLHIESDVIVAASLQLSAFELLSRPLCFGLISPGIGVGALVYSRNSKASDHLATYVLKRFVEQPDANDMEILGSYSMEYHECVSILPTSPKEDSSLYKPQVPGEFRRQTSEFTEHFGGIFDVATIGQFLAGKDPRNHQGMRHIYTVPEDHAIDPAQITFYVTGQKLIGVDPNRLYPEFPVLSLHIHSKDVRLFSLSTEFTLLKKRLRDYKGAPVREFSFWGFKEAVTAALSRRIKRHTRALNPNLWFSLGKH